MKQRNNDVHVQLTLKVLFIRFLSLIDALEL